MVRAWLEGKVAIVSGAVWRDRGDALRSISDQLRADRAKGGARPARS